MKGRIGGLRNGMTHVLALGALGLVVALSTLGQESVDEITAAPDDPDHALHCSVCQSPNHFGGLMPGPAPSEEVLNRIMAEDPFGEGEDDLGDADEVSEDEVVETAHHHKPRAFRRFHATRPASVSHPGPAARGPSAS